MYIYWYQYVLDNLWKIYVCKFGDCSTSVNSVRVRVNRMYGRTTKLYGSDESEGPGWAPAGVFSVRYSNQLCVCT